MLVLVEFGVDGRADLMACGSGFGRSPGFGDEGTAVGFEGFVEPFFELGFGEEGRCMDVD